MANQPWDTDNVIRINGERYFVLTETGRAVSGGLTPIQNAPFDTEFEVDLSSGAGGAGYSHQGPPGTYSHASGWDATAPDKISTYGRIATGATFTSADYKGWALYHGGYLYLLRGRYAAKYLPDATRGSVWAKVGTDKDFGANNLVAGRPVSFQGKMYVPIISDSGTLQLSQELTTVGSPDTWTAFGTRTFQCFQVWRNQLRAGQANRVYSCSVTPTTSTNWLPAVGSGYEVGDSSNTITDMLAFPGGLLMVGTNRGLWSFDEDTQSNLETPDIVGFADTFNCMGMAMSNGSALIPHRAGLVEWSPYGYRIIGPAQEGGMDGALSPGWGRITCITPTGKLTYFLSNDTQNGVASLGHFSIAEQRPRLPHFFMQEAGVTYEDACIITLSAAPGIEATPATWSDDSAVGTITWAGTANVASSDDSYATATVGTSHYLKGLNPNPGVPTLATVVGVEVFIERKVVSA